MSKSISKFVWIEYVGVFTLVGLLMFFYANRPFTSFIGALLILLAAMLTGFRLGRQRLVKDAGDSAAHLEAGEVDLDEKSLMQSASLSLEHDYFQGVIGELSVMQTSNDLLTRYQSFISMVESTLSHSLGRCNISLWCLDSGSDNLVECVIKPSSRPTHRSGSSDDGFRDKHVPCIVPLDSPVIKKSLEDRHAYLASELGTSVMISGRRAEVSLVCDGCIPLYREYGQPVVVNVESTSGVKRADKRKEFHSAVKLVELFWRHLQTVNQRQWEMEHDSHSGALRDSEFLVQAQVWADDCRKSDELFSLVVFTLRGFRRIFTNDSEQWRILSGIVGRSLNSVLSANSDNCILGKMADDVFAIMLRRSDEFLASSAMQRAADKLREAMEKDSEVDVLEVMGVEFQWSVADYKQYQGSVEQLLNKIYRRLFCQSQNKSEQIHQIVWEKQVDLVSNE